MLVGIIRRVGDTSLVVPLPTGTVTFLLTDIEASTRRWEQEPDAMRTALTEHDVLFERTVEQHDGLVVKPRGEGDSRFAVFPRATDAVLAAYEFQQYLSGTNWPTDNAIRVRIAIHTGEADVRDGDYYGSTVNRTARLRSLAWGGQVLISLATAQLVREQLPNGIELRDLGEHRLKDLSWPEHIFQLVIPDISDEFPVLQSLDRLTTNLPAHLTPFIGREQEIQQICDWLLEEHIRLVTLTGPGGSGKTRLCLHVAAEVIEYFPDGVYLVELEAITDPSLVLQSIGQTVGVHETGGIALEDNLRAHLRDKVMLLALDNFERVIDAAPQLASLLSANPHLKLLVTSREALRVQGEHELSVPPLGVPSPMINIPVEQLMEYEAVRLFVSRATEVQPGFQLTSENADAVATICRRLDGLPLAIELAAARVRLFSPQALLNRLDQMLTLLTGGARNLPVRQQTLRGTIAWSYDLLSEEEQAIFRRLSVFAGGFSLEGVSAISKTIAFFSYDEPLQPLVTEVELSQEIDSSFPSFEVLDTVDALLSKSLLYRSTSARDDEEPRFGILETIREFGLEQLTSSGEFAATSRAHAGYVLSLVERAEPEFQGPDQGGWIRRLEEEHRNVAAAMAWALDARDGVLGLRLAGALWPFWEVRGYFSEGRSWTERMLALDGPPALRAKTLTGAGTMAWYQGDSEQAEQFHAEALVIYQELGDDRGIAFALVNLGVQSMEQGDLQQANDLFDDAMQRYRQIGDESGRADVLNNLAIIAFHQDDLDRARDLVEESLSIRRTLGDKHRIADALYNLGEIAQFQSQFDDAITLYRECLLLRRELGALSGTALSLAALAAVATAQKEFERGARLLGAAGALLEAIGFTMDQTEQRRYELVNHELQERLGEQAYALLWKEGEEYSVEQAISYALSGLSGTDSHPSEPDPKTGFSFVQT